MKQLEPISVETARRLIDFRGAARSHAVTGNVADDQLEGAVALYNILGRLGFAYLADEVGMGKTYIALGVVGLLRYFKPDARILYIAPRENLQIKWQKELRNFTRSNWRYQDLRVKGIQGAPRVGFVNCENLADWARNVIRDPDRDCFLRLTSFSFPLADEDEVRWKLKSDELKSLAPMITPSLISVRTKSKEDFKKNYSRTINLLLPHYDLVIVDEAHNLKHGLKSQAARNQLLATTLGRNEDTDPAIWSSYGCRFDRVLFLSATPMETGYDELWRQLDIFGFGAKVSKLNDPKVDDDEKMRIASDFLIRRLTGLTIAGDRHTKNMYRREWRGGGCDTHDEPLSVPDARQRLVVALVQKKVAEVLKDTRFNSSFQIGMLASFESFMQTAKVLKSTADEEPAAFTIDGQTEKTDEIVGIDTNSINRLAESYKKTFRTALPHPKMDSVVQSLSKSLNSGEKSLVFVRRVKSVDELTDKLCRKYDETLFAEIYARLPVTLHGEFDEIKKQYDAERISPKRIKKIEIEPSTDATEGDSIDDEAIQPVEDLGGFETFFSWFFRGEGPDGILSGAAFKTNRLGGEGSAFSTFLEDNYIADLLGSRSSTEILYTLASNTNGVQPDNAREDLRNLAFTVFQSRSRAAQYPRIRVFEAYQAASLILLSRTGHPRAKDAETILRLCFNDVPRQAESAAPVSFPYPEEYLQTKTFFTELRLRQQLRQSFWPEQTGVSFEECFDVRERRRHLLAAVIRLGSPLIDLWTLFVRRLGSLNLKVRGGAAESYEALIEDFLNELDRQEHQAGFNAYRELSQVGENYESIMRINFPGSSQTNLQSLPKRFGATLSAQSPIAGMQGTVNKTVVQQFRMPGYPFILVTTDVLQEGEDLHTFCSSIVHYGIGWTPSAMEQRTGRIDRIGSLTHRRLDNRTEQPGEDEKLQVYYPYLAETVEVLQVERVFERMNKFIRLIHHSASDRPEESRLTVNTEINRLRKDIAQLKEPLTTRFPVRSDHLEGSMIEIEDPERLINAARSLLQAFRQEIGSVIRVKWENHYGQDALFGTVFIDGDRLLLPTDNRSPGTQGIRQQPIALHLRHARFDGSLLLHAISPVGILSQPEEMLSRLREQKLRGAKFCEVETKDNESYSLTVEGDILFETEQTQLDEVVDLIKRVSLAADITERKKLEDDLAFCEFREDLEREVSNATY